ncbi:MAG: CdaR family protein [Eubacteriales bacterium]|nr:CdaR family protein [Eubacteriales bacterium]
MKNKILENFALKLLAVLCAVLLWLVVLNISDYTVTVEIKDIPVEQLNGDVLEELDQIYDVEKGDTVDILVKGRRSIVERLDANDFIATADLSTMSITNTVQIFVEPKDHGLNGDITITCVDNAMTLSLEEKITVQFPVRINVVGEAKEGYAYVSTVASPNLITLEGPKSAIGRVTDIAVEVDISGRSDSFETIGKVYMYDAYGEILENDKIILSDTETKVNMQIYPTKTIEVRIELAGKPAEGYGVDEVLYQPQTITVAGPSDKTKQLNELVIRDISVNGASDSLQTTIDLADYLPEGIYLAQSNSEVAVNVSIEKQIQNTVSMTEKDITLTGKQSGCTYTVSLSDDFKLTAVGLPKAIETLSMEDIHPVIDCSTLKNGDNIDVKLIFEDLEGVAFTITGTVDVYVKDVKGN